MNNIQNTKNCYGCGVCAMVCGKKIISIVLNKDGFYEPTISDSSRCTGCGLCVEVCAFAHDTLATPNMPQVSYAAWSKDARIRTICSSGGVGFEIAKDLLAEGYKVCGVRYNTENKRAEHYIATELKELIPSTGSKYIQSYTVEAFKKINRKEKYLITGTPCQIDSFRRYIKKIKAEDNFILMDFFCHGTPSIYTWKRYEQMVEKQVGPLTYVSWRNKLSGQPNSWNMSIDSEKHNDRINWHDSYNMLIKGEKQFYNSKASQGDIFYQLFFRNACLGKACYSCCKYKYNHSSADIRIGDLWGKTYESNQKGVSALIAFSQRGRNIIQKLKSTELVKHPFETVAEGQISHRLNEPQTARIVVLSLLRQKMIPLKLIVLIMKVLLKLTKKNL